MAKSVYEEYSMLPQKLLDEVRDEAEANKLKSEEVRKVLERVKSAFDSSQLCPGEAIGIVTAESIGEPGTQMCTSYDEKVIFKFRNRIKIMKIGEFVDKLFERVKTRVKDSYEIYNPSEEILVLSLDQDEKLKWRKVLALNRVKSPKKLIKITTQSGRSIIATDYHSFVTRKNNSIVSIAGKDLFIGDRIPVMQYLPEYCASYILVKNYISDSVEENGMLMGKFGMAKPIPNKIKLDKLFGWFIGAYLAEGHANIGQVGISNVSREYVFNLKEFTESIGLNYKEEWSSRGFALGCNNIVSSSLLAKFVKSVCNTGSRNKKVPEFAYSAKNEFVSALLRGYFDGDGNFHASRKMIRVSSNSKELRDGVAILLNRFNIFSYKITDKKGQYWLLISYKYAPLYLQHIGSDIDYKKKALEKLSEESKKFWNEKSQDYTDMVSGFGNLFYDAAKKLGMPTRYVNNFTKRQRIGRTALFRYMKKFELLAKEQNVNINDELKIMNRMFNSDVIWDAIEKIEYIDYKHEYVYDLSVPGLETFTTFDGVITHNTLNVFHFAGVAEVAVTLGLPRLIELLDARKEPSTPKIEVYLQKDIAKDPIAVKKVAAAIKQTKFGELVEEFTINMTQFRIEVYLDKKKMRDFGITENYVSKILEDTLKNVSVKTNKDFIAIRPKAEQFELKELYQLREKCRDLHVKGVKGIKQVLPVKRDNEFIVICVGNNLEDVLDIEGVDCKKTVTNDIFKTEAVLGIEAARQAIINEAVEVIENQGLDIDIRHIMLLADVMTSAGAIKGITRSGITGEKESVLARASFETPIKHIINATLKGEEDKLNSVIENVMLNQEIPVGTGLPSLIAKMRTK